MTKGGKCNSPLAEELHVRACAVAPGEKCAWKMDRMHFSEEIFICCQSLCCAVAPGERDKALERKSFRSNQVLLEEKKCDCEEFLDVIALPSS